MFLKKVNEKRVTYKKKFKSENQKRKQFSYNSIRFSFHAALAIS